MPQTAAATRSLVVEREMPHLPERSGGPLRKAR